MGGVLNTIRHNLEQNSLWKKEKLEEFKKLVQDIRRVVEANEPDTINYKYYLERDDSKCIVNEQT
jgi:hypothetical protein